MKINMMGIRQQNSYPFVINRPNGSGDFLFIYTHTNAKIYFHQIEYDFPKNSFVIFPKGETQHYCAVAGGYIDDYIHFDLGDDFSLDRGPYEIPLNQIVTMPFSSSYEMLLKELYMQYISTAPHKDIVIDHLLKAFFIMISDLSSVFREDRILSEHYSSLLKLRSEIYEKPSYHWTVPDMADKLGLSVSYFQKIYRDTFQISCYNDVIISKTNYAKTLLASTFHSIRVIAYMCGYENDVHFMRQFKQFTGETPTGYRKKMEGHPVIERN